MRIINVEDRHNDFIGAMYVHRSSLATFPLDETIIGKLIVYVPPHKMERKDGGEAGIITSFTEEFVFARYHKGDTAAGGKRENMFLAL